MLSEHPDKAKAILGTLTNLFDGEYDKAIGTSFEGSAVQRSKSRFSMVFAVTVAMWITHSQIVEQTGARAMIYLAEEMSDEERQRGYALAKDSRKKEHRVRLGEQVTARLRAVIQAKAPIAISDGVDEWLQLGAEFIACGRTPIRSERITIDDDGRQRHVESPGETEGSMRIYQQLYYKLRNLCRVNGHLEPTPHELRLVQRVILSSISLRWAQLVLAVWEVPAFTVKDITARTKISPDATSYRIRCMKAIGLLEQEKVQGPYRIAGRFQPLLQLPPEALREESPSV